MKNTVVIEIAVIVDGGSDGYKKRSIGVKIKPPPAPINVPNVPTKVPRIRKPIISNILK